MIKLLDILKESLNQQQIVDIAKEFMSSKNYNPDHDCKRSTFEFIKWAKKNKGFEPTTLLLAPPKDIKKFPGKSKDGDSHIFSIIDGYGVDFTANQFPGISEPLKITPENQIPSEYKKIGGYYTLFPDWFEKGKTSIKTKFNNLPQWFRDGFEKEGFKIETILKELNIQSKDPIGQGGEQTVYPSKIKPGFVIKKFTGENKYFTKEDWTKIIKTAQQHPEVFAEIDKVDFDKGYFVQEKLDEKSLTKDGNDLYNYLKTNNILYRNNQDKNNYSGLDIITILYMDPDRINMLDNTPWKNTLKPKFEHFFNKLNQAGYGIDNDNYLGDLKLTNVGYDKNGEIKILDFNFDEL